MHNVTVTPNGEYWTVRCSCGWSLNGLRYKASAEDLGNAHKERVAAGEES